MAYFKINDTDYSQYVSSLKVAKKSNYNAQTNAAGDTVADYINSKRTIEVGVIPLDSEYVKTLLNAIDNFNITITFLNPNTGELENVNCIIPDNEVDYYTIRADKKSFKAFNLGFIEL